MKKLLISLVTVGAVAVAAFGATQAFFSDTETSEGNILQAGALDLKIDNTCYYNGNACVDGIWQGGGNIGVGNSTCSCTWTSTDLSNEVFFDLHDLKPGDWEEDTISLTVKDNDAWACVDINVDEHTDNGCTDPEIEAGDPHCANVGDPGDVGEIAQELNFIFWVDDGDNVLEDGENIITRGPADEVLDGVRWTLADSLNNILGGGGPLTGAQTYYIGKAFCYGILTPEPVEPGDQNSPTIDPGIDCDGSGVGNISQTDKLTGDIVFEAVQSRNNELFVCNELAPPPGE